MGEELMSLALKWLEEQKCETVRVSIAEGNENVHDFYRRFGFAERLTVMQLTERGDQASEALCCMARDALDKTLLN